MKHFYKQQVPICQTGRMDFWWNDQVYVLPPDACEECTRLILMKRLSE